MRYRVQRLGDGLEIALDDIGGDEARVIEALKECRGGRCHCPSEEYRKLESLRIDREQAGLKVLLRPAPGERIDAAEVERCLAYVARERNPEDR